MPERKGKSRSSSVQTPDETNDSYKVWIDAEKHRLAFLKFCGTKKDTNAIEKFSEFANDLHQILPKDSATSEEPSNYVIVTRAEYKAGINTILDRREANSKERLDFERRADRVFRELRKSSLKNDKIFEEGIRRIRTEAFGLFGRSEFFINREEMTKPEILQKKEGGKNPEHADIAEARMPEVAERHSPVEIIFSAASQLTTLDDCRESLTAIQQRARELGVQRPENQLPLSDISLSHEMRFQQSKGFVSTEATPAELQYLNSATRQRLKELPESEREKLGRVKSYRQRKEGNQLYWYAYYWDEVEQKTKSDYIGKDLPEGVSPSTHSVTFYTESQNQPVAKIQSKKKVIRKR
jgi:DNA uptake protein ComE-like DNA-binding protein